MAVEDSSPRKHWEPEYEHSGIEVDLDLVRDHLCARDGSERVGLVDPGAHDEETENWATQALGQDIGNLLAVVALLLSGYGYYTGSHRARLVWPGTLLYLLDAYVVYSMAVHFNELFLVHVAALGLSSYAVMFSMDGLRTENAASPQPSARKPAGYTSIAIGVVFGLLWLSGTSPPGSTEFSSGRSPAGSEDVRLPRWSIVPGCRHRAQRARRSDVLQGHAAGRAARPDVRARAAWPRRVRP